MVLFVYMQINFYLCENFEYFGLCRPQAVQNDVSQKLHKDAYMPEKQYVRILIYETLTSRVYDTDR